jgi:hypothetical protein
MTDSSGDNDNDNGDDDNGNNGNPGGVGDEDDGVRLWMMTTCPAVSPKTSPTCSWTSLGCDLSRPA